MKHYFISWTVHVHADLSRYLRPDHISFFNEKQIERKGNISGLKLKQVPLSFNLAIQVAGCG